jgi:hypothetical protein
VKNVDQVSDVLVHIDPENDEKDMGRVAKLPSREILLAELEQRWQTIVQPDAVKKVTLHYLEGQVRVDLYLALSDYDSKEQMEQTANDLRQAILAHPLVSHASIHFAY